MGDKPVNVELKISFGLNYWELFAIAAAMSAGLYFVNFSVYTVTRLVAP